ncbi:MAG: DUF4112 domain-containing protein [Pseudomonadota bacterium]
MAETSLPCRYDARAHNRIERMARLLDSGLRIPGTEIRFGADALIGALPVVGDTLSLGLSLWLIRDAHKAGCRRSTLLRMGANAAFDWALGLVPILGDALDIANRANARNARLALEDLRG